MKKIIFVVACLMCLSACAKKEAPKDAAQDAPAVESPAKADDANKADAPKVDDAVKVDAPANPVA